MNYVENHDNQTLFDINALRLLQAAPRRRTARAWALAWRATLFSQGVACACGHRNLEKQIADRTALTGAITSTRIDWTYQSNNFAQACRRWRRCREATILLVEVPEDPRIKPAMKEILWTRDAFLDLLYPCQFHAVSIAHCEGKRSSVTMLNTGPEQIPGLFGSRWQWLCWREFQEDSRTSQRRANDCYLVPEGWELSGFELAVHRANVADTRKAQSAQFDDADHVSIPHVARWRLSYRKPNPNHERQQLQYWCGVHNSNGP